MPDGFDTQGFEDLGLGTNPNDPAGSVTVPSHGIENLPSSVDTTTTDKTSSDLYKLITGSDSSASADLSGLSDFGKSLAKLGLPTALASFLGSSAGLASLAGLYGLMGGNRPQTGGYKGTIPKYTMTRTALPQPEYKPYSGEAVMGRDYFTPTTYTKEAATGGIMNLAKGRYLQGATDGMADEIDTSIDGKEPAKLSHGEFVIPADVVSHLGNGNSDAGAKVLYKMMDRVREARTGTTKQGKEINPAKFTPGGSAGYAGGGEVKSFADGGATTTGLPASSTATNPATTYGTTQSSSLADWAGSYVTDMLGRAQALANAPTQFYQGPLSAGVSPLQQQAFSTAAGLSVPKGIGTAAQTLGGVAQAAGKLSYAPTTFSNVFTAPADYTSGIFANQFAAPTTYQPITGSITDTGIAQSYMNPYMQQVLQPQMQAMQRQADIQRQTLGAQAAQAGAFGGSRSGLMQNQLNAELMRQQQQATGQAYGTAYQQAVGQFNTEQARRASEAQFAAQQQMASAQQAAQYGLAAQQAAEQSRQFAAQQKMTAAQQYAQYAQAAQQAAEQSKQYAAQYGLNALAQKLAAAQAQGQLSAQQAQIANAIAAQQLAAGLAQRTVEQEGIAAAKEQFDKQQQDPYAKLRFQQQMLQGLPIGTTVTTPNISGIGQLGLTGSQITGLVDLLNKVPGLKTP